MAQQGQPASSHRALWWLDWFQVALWVVVVYFLVLSFLTPVWWLAAFAALTAAVVLSTFHVRHPAFTRWVLGLAWFGVAALYGTR